MLDIRARNEKGFLIVQVYSYAKVTTIDGNGCIILQPTAKRLENYSIVNPCFVYEHKHFEVETR